MINTLTETINLMYSDRDSSHGIEHFDKVLQNTLQTLSLLEGSELEQFNKIPNARLIVKAAAYLHDTRDHKYCSSEEGQRVQKVFDQILINYLTEEEIIIVNLIIDNVSFSKEKRGETENLSEYNILLWIVQGADRKEAIGQIGLDRCREYNTKQRLANNLPIDEYLIVQDMIEHCHDKLLHIQSEYIHCKASLQLLTDEHQIIVNFVENC